MILTEKIKIFGHFLMCKAKSRNSTPFNIHSINVDTACIAGPDGQPEYPIEECKLILKPLESMIKKDAAKCAELAGLPAALYRTWEVSQDVCLGKTVFTFPDGSPNFRNMIIFSEDKLNSQQVDYLRSQGYAVGVPRELYTINE